MRTEKIRLPLKAVGAVLVLMLLVAVSAFGKVKADETVTVTEINYENSTITVRLGSGDKALQISDSKQKSWEAVLEEPENGSVTMDISWISVTKEYVLSLRGDKNTTPVTVTLPAQDKNFKVKYSPVDGITFTDKGDGRIQWKKKDGIKWQYFPDNEADFNKTLEGMIIKGCDLVFRTAPVNGNGSSSGKRASKEVSVKIKAKTAAPTVTIDTNKMTVSLKKNMEYRYCDENGNIAEGTLWNEVEKDEEKALSEIASEAMAGVEAGKNVYIQFRNKATSNSQLSNIATVTIPGQKPLNNSEIEGISIEYTSPSSLNLNIAAASAKVPFEYTVISEEDAKDGITIDNGKKLTWTAVLDSKAVPITKSKAGDGSVIYVRKKASGTQGGEDFQLPSPEHALPSITYPKELSTLSDEVVWIHTIAGLCRPGIPGNYLQFSNYSSVNAPIGAIEMTVVGSTAKVTLDASDFTSSVRTLTDADKQGMTDQEKEDYKYLVTTNLPLTDADKQGMTDQEKEDYKYLVTTTIKDTSKLEASMKNGEAKEYLLSYKQGNQSDFFASSLSTGGVGIYLQPKSSVQTDLSAAEITELNSSRTKGKKIAGDEGKFCTEFTRYYNSNSSYEDNGTLVKDSSVFSFVVELGVKYAPVKNTRGELTNSGRGVMKLVYDGVEFWNPAYASGGASYFVTDYVDYTTGNVEKRKVIVTVDLKAMENNPQIKAKGEMLPLGIYLSNGEYLEGDIKVKFEKTGVIVKDENSTESITISKSVRAILNTTTTTTTTINDITTTTTKEDDVFDCVYIYLNDSLIRENVEIERVTWGDTSIFTKADRTGRYICVEISKTKLNEIFNTINTKTSKNVIFSFDNGFVLTEGYKIVFDPQSE